MNTSLRHVVLVLALMAPGGCEDKPTLAPRPAADGAEGEGKGQDRGAIPPSRGGLADAYRGAMEPELAITMRLKRDGERLSGSYFYDAKGLDIPLQGSLEADGAVALREAVGGKKTGEIKGRLDVAGTFNGEWSDGAGGARRLVRLDPIERRAGEPAIVRKRWIHSRGLPRAAPPAEARIKQCNRDLSYPEVYGLENPEVEAAINEKLKAAQVPARADDPCETPYARSGSYAVHWNRGGVLSVSYTWDHACESCPRPLFGGAALNLLLATGAEIPLGSVIAAGSRGELIEALHPHVRERIRVTKDAQEGDARALLTAYAAGDYVFEDAGIRFIGFFRLQPTIQALDGGYGAVIPWVTLLPLLAPGSPAAVWTASPPR